MALYVSEEQGSGGHVQGEDSLNTEWVYIDTGRGSKMIGRLKIQKQAKFNRGTDRLSQAR